MSDFGQPDKTADGPSSSKSNESQQTIDDNGKESADTKKNTKEMSNNTREERIRKVQEYLMERTNRSTLQRPQPARELTFQERYAYDTNIFSKLFQLPPGATRDPYNMNLDAAFSPLGDQNRFGMWEPIPPSAEEHSVPNEEPQGPARCLGSKSLPPDPKQDSCTPKKFKEE